jgi:hypothetical protein
MSHESAHGQEAGPGSEHFSAEEQAMLHADDRHAATQVVGLMVGVFTGGLLMYLIVALTF